MTYTHRKNAVVFITVLHILALAVQADVAREFEEKYQKWREWREQHLEFSTHTKCQEYKDIVDLGVPALPHISDKMSANLDDFDLGIAVLYITKKQFQRNEWPAGKFADSITASKMYLEWWETERFQTPQQFSERLRQWQEAKKLGDAKAAAEAFRAILYLGLPALPHLVDQMGQFPELVTAFSVLVGEGNVATAAYAVRTGTYKTKFATPAECRRYWETNKAQYTLPGQVEGERKWASLWVSQEEKIRQFENAFAFPKKSTVMVSVNDCFAITNQLRSTVMGEYVIDWWQMFTLGAYTIYPTPDKYIVCGWGKLIACKDDAEARRRAIGEHIESNIHYRHQQPAVSIANSVVGQKDVGDFSIQWSSDKKNIIFVRGCMIVVVSMQNEKDTLPFAKALDELILKCSKGGKAKD